MPTDTVQTVSFSLWFFEMKGAGVLGVLLTTLVALVVIGAAVFLLSKRADLIAKVFRTGLIAVSRLKRGRQEPEQKTLEVR
jgi:hypothetical protein